MPERFFGVVLNTVISRGVIVASVSGNGRGAPRHAVALSRAPLTVEWRSQNAGFARGNIRICRECRLRKKRSNAAVPHTAAIAIEPLINRLRSIPKVSPSGVVNGPALVVFSGKKCLFMTAHSRQYLLIIQLLN